MPKNIEDIIPPERRRSIRNIPIPEGRRKSDQRSAKVSSESAAKAGSMDGLKKRSIPEELVVEEASMLPPRRPTIPRHNRSARKRIWLSAGVALIILGFVVLSVFNGATLAYVPKSALLNFENEVYTARKTGEGNLFYSVVKLSREKGMTVPAGGEQQVSRKASGTIVVYNNASTEPQRLIENTRFESPSGKIYRIQTAITIPGKTAAPGSIEVTVYADQPGAEYNSGLTDFTVPGLKGTPRYTTIYARSKTPMTGGLIGMEKSVSAEDLATSKTELEAALKDDLWEEAKAEVPGDFILFPSLSSFVFEEMPQTAGEGNNVTLNLRGHLYGVMFKKSDLSNFLSAKKIALTKEEMLDVTSYESLILSFAGTPPADLLPENVINFKVSGSATVLWRTDEVALRADLAGRHKKDVATILKNYPTIASASATVRPFWKSSLPEEADKITVKKLPID